MRLRPEADGLRLIGCLLAGDTRSEAWLRPLLQDGLVADAYGRSLLAPGSTPPVAMAARGKQVCTCFNVSESAITTALSHCPGSDDERLARLQGKLKCGTNCGSCIPALRKLVKLHPVPETQS